MIYHFHGDYTWVGPGQGKTMSKCCCGLPGKVIGFRISVQGVFIMYLQKFKIHHQIKLETSTNVYFRKYIVMTSKNGS